MLVVRKLNQAMIEACIQKPDEILPAKGTKKAYVKDFGKNYLKVIVSEEREAYIIITTYWFAKKRVLR